MRRRWAIVKRYLSVGDLTYLGQAIVKRYSSVGEFLFCCGPDEALLERGRIFIEIWFIFKFGIHRRMSEQTNFLTGA